MLPLGRKGLHALFTIFGTSKRQLQNQHFSLEVDNRNGNRSRQNMQDVRYP